jgi:pilus assembly protein CpaF
MGVVERLARQVMAEPIAVDRSAIAARVAELLSSEAPLHADAYTAAAVVDTLVGMGPIEPLLRDPEVSDVLVNGDGSVWIEQAGELQETAIRFESPAAVVAAVERAIAPLGLRIDRASPAVDARLPDGSRLHAVVPPAAVDGPVVAVRRFTEAVADLDQLHAQGGITRRGAEHLRDLVVSRSNIMVCGSTGSGKTTLLNVLSREIPDIERIVTIEDAAELRLDGHVVRLEGRPPNSEGSGGIEMRQLLRHALRLRPDRIIVGEVRGPEAFDMLQAMSTGHRGSMSTIHASSASEALWRLETLAMAADVPAAAESIRRQVQTALDVVITMERCSGSRIVRSVTSIGAELEETYRCP